MLSVIVLSVIVLNVVMLSVVSPFIVSLTIEFIMLRVIRLSVRILNVVAPNEWLLKWKKISLGVNNLGCFPGVLANFRTILYW